MIHHSYQGQHWQKQITYYRRNFQNDRTTHSLRNPPGKLESSNSIHVSKQLFSDQRGKMKRDEHIQIVMKTMKLIISYWIRMHTIENSKAEGYIRNNCETQSIHYKIDIKTRGTLLQLGFNWHPLYACSFNNCLQEKKRPKIMCITTARLRLTLELTHTLSSLPMVRTFGQMQQVIKFFLQRC